MKGIIYMSSAWMCFLMALLSLESYFTGFIGLHFPLYIIFGLLIISLVFCGLSYFGEVSKWAKIFRRIFLFLIAIVIVAIALFMYSLNQAFIKDSI